MCSGNMQQIYRGTFMPKLLCNFIEIALRHGCSPVNLRQISRTPLPKNTSEGLLRYILQKQPSTDVLKKTCSENMQQIYRRTPMPVCDFNKITKQLYWNGTLAWLFSCRFVAYFQNTFSLEHFWTAASDSSKYNLRFMIFRKLINNIAKLG